MFRLTLLCLLVAGCARNHSVTVNVQMVTCSASLHYETTIQDKGPSWQKTPSN